MANGETGTEPQLTLEAKEAIRGYIIKIFTPISLLAFLLGFAMDRVVNQSVQNHAFDLAASKLLDFEQNASRAADDAARAKQNAEQAASQAQDALVKLAKSAPSIDSTTDGGCATIGADFQMCWGTREIDVGGSLHYAPFDYSFAKPFRSTPSVVNELVTFVPSNDGFAFVEYSKPDVNPLGYKGNMIEVQDRKGAAGSVRIKYVAVGVPAQ